MTTYHASPGRKKRLPRRRTTIPSANFRMKLTTTVITFLAGLSSLALAQSPYSSSADFAKFASHLREKSLLKLEPQVIIPTERSKTRYPWKTNIVTTVFWVGELAAQNNPVHNISSSWDLNWKSNFGGYDDPKDRVGLPNGGSIPRAFVPKENPFYFALPYNDRLSTGFKPEADEVIPWYKTELRLRGDQSVCRDRWMAIRKTLPGGKQRVCYAQWSDCGPFRTDHHEYVFGNDRPRPNLNQGAGLDVSPAVRDYLGVASTDVVDWCFVEWSDVPQGPWADFGSNNHLVIAKQRDPKRMLVQNSKPAKKAPPPDDEPVVVAK